MKELFTLVAVGSAAFMGLAFPWFSAAVSAYTGWPPFLATAVLSAASVFLEPQFFVLAAVWYCLRRCPSSVARTTPPSLALFAAAAYVASEEIAPTKILADSLGLGLWPVLEWAQAADLGGVPLLTFALLFANACIACTWEDLMSRRWCRGAILTLALAAATPASLWLYGTWRLRTVEVAASRVDRPYEFRIGLVQGNISHYDRLREQMGTFGAVRYILDRYLGLTQTLPVEADLWAWPETVYPTTFAKPKSHDGLLFDREIAAFVQRHQRPLIFGAYDRDDLREYNAAFALLPEPGGGMRIQVQRKLHPFPFTEHVPQWLDSGWLRERFPWLGTWSPGTELDVVEMRGRDGTRFAVAILLCYDAILREPARLAAGAGADVLLSLSNDSWFESGTGKRWALVASAFRSIETRKPQVRVTPTGISAVIQPSGDVHVLVPQGVEGAALARIELGPGNATFWVKWGAWLPWVSVLGTSLPLGLWARRRLQSSAKL